MADQFAETSEQPGAGQPDEGDDTEDHELDEGYAPPRPWSGPEDDEPGAGGVAQTEPLEQRLEQEDADVEDDWDED